MYKNKNPIWQKYISKSTYKYKIGDKTYVKEPQIENQAENKFK